MGPSLRLGGRVELPSGKSIVWSVADGRRGRRWREVATRHGAVAWALLFETESDGRMARLEMSSAAGLLTLHPVGAGVLHGNVVTPTSIRHLSFPEAPGVSLFVVASPAAAAIALGSLAGTVALGETVRVTVLRIDARLEPQPATWDVSRVEERRWRLVSVPGEAPSSDAAPEVREVRLDGSGLVDLPGEMRWPLEL